MEDTIQVVQATSPDGVCSLKIPNHLLYIWHSGNHNGQYVEEVNEKVNDGALMLKNSPVVENRIRVRAFKVSKKISEASKKKRMKMKSEHSTIMVYPGEVVRPQDQEEEITWMSQCLDEYE